MKRKNKINLWSLRISLATNIGKATVGAAADENEVDMISIYEIFYFKDKHKDVKPHDYHPNMILLSYIGGH